MGRPLNKDALVEAALDLLSGLSSAPSHCMDIAQAASELALSVAQVEQVVDAIQQLADSYTGTRAGVYLDGRQIVLDGSAGSIAGIRLTHDELLAAEQVIRRFQLDEGVHKRFRDALAPRDDADSKDAQFSFEAMTAADPLFGGFYQQLTEAIADGVRLRIDYTSKRDSKPTARTIDPGYLFMSHGGAFLAAWDVEKDEQRSYRLPCISAVEKTDDWWCRTAMTTRTRDKASPSKDSLFCCVLPARTRRMRVIGRSRHSTIRSVHPAAPSPTDRL